MGPGLSGRGFNQLCNAGIVSKPEPILPTSPGTVPPYLLRHLERARGSRAHFCPSFHVTPLPAGGRATKLLRLLLVQGQSGHLSQSPSPSSPPTAPREGGALGTSTRAVLAPSGLGWTSCTERHPALPLSNLFLPASSTVKAGGAGQAAWFSSLSRRFHGISEAQPPGGPVSPEDAQPLLQGPDDWGLCKELTESSRPRPHPCPTVDQHRGTAWGQLSLHDGQRRAGGQDPVSRPHHPNPSRPSSPAGLGS